MNTKLEIAGINLTIAGVFLLASRLINIIPILYNWYPEDIITAAKLSLVLAILGFIILITAGRNLVKASEQFLSQ